jgi:hypothetical protein
MDDSSLMLQQQPYLQKPKFMQEKAQGGSKEKLQKELKEIEASLIPMI